MISVPFLPIHLQGFDLQKEQSLFNKYLIDQYYIDTIGQYGEAWTGLVDGKVKVIAGVIQPHQHIGMVWALLSKDCNKHMIGATRAISRWLEDCKILRLETAIRREFPEGHRWAEMLGFTNETPEVGMKNFGLDGKTYDLYARYN